MSESTKITYEAFLHSVSERSGGTIADLDRFLHHIGPVIEDALKQEGKVGIADFGAFDLREIAEHQGHDPRTQAEITIPAYTRIHFSPFQALRRSVNWPYRSAIKSLEQRPHQYSWQKIASAAVFATILGILAVFLAGLITGRISDPMRWATWFKAPPQLQVSATAAMIPLPKPVAINEPVAAPAAAPAVVASSDPGPALAFSAYTQVAVQDDTFWDLATDVWRDATWWPILYAANRSQLSIADPDQLPTGMRLQVPALEGGPTAASQDDLQRLTAAYKLVGQDYEATNNSRSSAYLRIGNRGY